MLPGGGSTSLQTGARFFTHHRWSNREEEGAGWCQDQTQLRTHRPVSTGERWGDRYQLLGIPADGWEQQDGNHSHPMLQTREDLQQPHTAASCQTGATAPAAARCRSILRCLQGAGVAVAALQDGSSSAGGSGEEGAFPGSVKAGGGMAGYSRGYSKVQKRVALKKPFLKHAFKQNKAGDAAGGER